ncbi:hypothetical protein ABEY43_07020 [Priestia megaterium]
MSKINKIIYAGDLVSEFDIDMKKAYKILEFMRDRGLVERAYEMNSNVCKCINGKVYNTIMSVPDNCPECGYEINCLEETIMVYRTLR